MDPAERAEWRERLVLCVARIAQRRRSAKLPTLEPDLDNTSVGRDLPRPRMSSPFAGELFVWVEPLAGRMSVKQRIRRS